MALVKCKECGAEISNKAEACPKCGAKPAKKTSVGTWLVVILLVLVGYSVATMDLDTGQAPPSSGTSSGSAGRSTGTAPEPSTAREPACRPADFEVVSFTPRIERSGSRNQFTSLRLLGELRNGCELPQGAELQIIARDADGELVDSATGWPASTGNIPAGGTHAIDFTGLMNYNDRMETFEARVVRVRQW